MFKTHEITTYGTFEQFGLVKEEVSQWIIDNLEPLPTDNPNPWAKLGSGYIMEDDRSRFGCYKVDERGEEIWRMECTDTGTKLLIVAHAEGIDYDDPPLVLVDKKLLKELQEQTTLVREPAVTMLYSELIPENKEYFCVGPKNWWKSNFERVSEASDLAMYAHLNIKPWLATNPGKRPIDYPCIKRNDGGIVPKEHPEWFNEAFAHLIENFQSSQEAIAQVDKEIVDAKNHLSHLEKKRNRLFSSL